MIILQPRPMENVTTEVLDRKIRCIKTYTFAYVKIQKNEDLQSIMANLPPNCWLKVDFQKVDQLTGGKWLIHDTKRHKDN